MCQSLSNFAHRFRVFKARMVYYASFERNYWCADGSQHVPGKGTLDTGLSFNRNAM